MKKPISQVLCCVLTGGLIMFNMVPVFASNNSQNKGPQSMMGGQGHKQPPPPGDQKQQNGMNNPGGQQGMNSGQNQSNGPGQNMNGGNGQQPVGRNIISQAADILGLTESELLDELKDGKTLADIAIEQGVTDFVAQLVDAEEAAIDQAYSDGKITEEQADQMKEDLTERIEKMVESTGQAHQGRQQGQQNNEQQNNRQQNCNGLQLVGVNIISEAADIFGLTESELLDELKDGKTLADIAIEQGVTDLVAELVEAEEAAIDQAYNDGKITEEQVDKMKEDLIARIKKMVESTEPEQWQQQNQSDNGMQNGFGQTPVGGSVIVQAANYLGLDESDIQDELKDGSSLVDIAESEGYTEAELLAQLITVQTAAINQALTDDKISSDQAEDLLDNLSAQLTKIIEQEGLKA